MTRQRIHIRRLGLAELGLRLLVAALGLAMLFYGAMIVLAALKLSPASIDQISAYRTLDHTLSDITAMSITGRDRIIVAAAGLGCLSVFGSLAWRVLPRPYLARTQALLKEQSVRGATTIGPRALERAAEVAASRDALVAGARARADSGRLGLDVELRDLDGPLACSLERIRQRVHSSLAEQGLPRLPVEVTLTATTLKRPSKEQPS